MTDKTTLGDRMKDYEMAYDLSMPKKLPVIIRCDGKGFSRFTKLVQAEKPFDQSFSNAMKMAMLNTAQQIEGCVFGYTQSDEITYILRNDQSEESEPWFGNRIQKVLSVVASMTSVHFAAQTSGLPSAYFDARVFVVPNIQEALNCLVWRQNDATKNSISAACYYEVGKKVGKKTARKMMHGLNQKQQQELLFKETNINWNNYPNKYKRGVACYKVKSVLNINGEEVERSNWFVNEDLPVFAKDQEFLKSII